MIENFKTWSSDENQSWKLLATRQSTNLHGKASERWWNGFNELHLNTKAVPDFNQVNTILTPATNWRLVESKLAFADGQSWFTSLMRNEFMVTDYIRPADSLDYTPMPDVFHDAFGHLPMLMDSQFSRIVRKFSALMLAAQPDRRKQLGHIWWYTVEFGLIKEHGSMKAIGAGIASSFGEANNIFNGQTTVLPFDVAVVGNTAESPTRLHDTLFLLESLDQLEAVLDTWK